MLRPYGFGLKRGGSRVSRGGGGGGQERRGPREGGPGLAQAPGMAPPAGKPPASPPPTVSYSRWAVPSPAERTVVTITATFFAWSWRPEPPAFVGAPPSLP